ncbi:ABC transporter ATP-binding protein, partial [Enterococcus sp. S181_ASV_20]|nr:ABC transporter ATP-binding protein [Enterococcus sp. S181_ASV_20]
PVGSHKIMKTVKTLNENGMTIIMVDHDMEKIASLANRILVMKEGKLVLNDTPEGVFSNPRLMEYGVSAPDSVSYTHLRA